MEKFIKPTDAQLTSPFGPRWGKEHFGVDFAKTGDKVAIGASASGTVTRSYLSTSYGECVFVKHEIDGQVYETVYAHMRSGSRTVKVGDKVKQGQLLGFMGSTGDSTGQHLHFELHKGLWNKDKTNAIDPLPYLAEIPRDEPPIPVIPKSVPKPVTLTRPYPGKPLRVGSKGRDVEAIQRALGFGGNAVDGNFGRNTEAAVKAYQTKHKLTADGIVGKVTWDVMF